jgi:hypothetical protein
MFATGVNITVYYGGLVGSGQHLGGCAVMVMMALRSGVGLMLVDRRLSVFPSGVMYDILITLCLAVWQRWPSQ